MPKMYFKSKKTGKLTPFFGASPNNKDYNNLNNKPKINGVTLQGEKTAKDIGLVSPEELDKKVDKINESEKVYATDKFGRTTSIQYNETPYGSGLAKRTSGGQVKTTDPVADDDSTPKKYVEEHYTDKATTELLQKEVDHLKSNVLDFVEDDSTAYIKDVPVGASPKAVITEIGGRTYKYKSPNLFDENRLVGECYLDDFVIDITDLLTVGHTYSIGAEFTNVHGLNPWIGFFGDNTAGSPVQDNPLTFTGEYDVFITMYMNINVNVTMVNGKLHFVDTSNPDNYFDANIMLNEGSSKLPYEPYGEGLRDTKCTEVKSMSKNLISNITKFGGNQWDFKFRKTSATRLTISFNKAVPQILAYFNDGTYKTLLYNNYFVAFENKNIDFLRVDVAVETNSVEELVAKVKPQIEIGETPTAYAPSAELDSLPIPQEVQDMEGYGKSYTSMDFEKFKDKSNTVHIDEKWYPAEWVQFNSVFYTNHKIDKKGIKAYQDFITNYSGIIAWSNEFLNTFQFETKDLPNPPKNVQEWLNYLKNNPIDITYETEEEVTTPVSQYFPKGGTLKVQGGGSIIVENAEKKPVPSRVLYSVNRKPKLQMPQQLKVVGTTASWVAVPNATNYTLFIDSTLIGSIATTTRDLSQTPAWSTISSGTHTLNVIATANDYADSDTAMVNFVKG